MNEQDLRNALQIALKPPKPRKGKERAIQAACMNGGKIEKRDVRLIATPNGINTLVAASLAPGQLASIECSFADCGGALWTWKEVQGGTEVAHASRFVTPNSPTSWNVAAIAWVDSGLFEGNAASGFELAVPCVAKAA